MKVTVNRWNAIAHWRWDTGQEGDGEIDEDSEEDLCGICRVSYDGCCPTCKVPGDDCPLSKCLIATCYNLLTLITSAVWGKCSHVFHMHCLLKWINTASSKQQCPMDRKPWGKSCCLSCTAELAKSLFLQKPRKARLIDPQWRTTHNPQTMTKPSSLIPRLYSP